jgi:hypothetical protein
MRVAFYTMAIFVVMTIGVFAQQDPDDPGIQDSMIVSSTEAFADTSMVQLVFVDIYAVSDDSVKFYNIPLRWNSPLGGVIPIDITYYFPFCWEERYDTILYAQHYIRMVGFSGWGDNCALYTDSVRERFASIRFMIPANTPSQLIALDSCWDDRNGSLLFGLSDGMTEVTPGFQYGYISIIPLGIENEPSTPRAFSLSQNYPNPFNSSTTVEFSLPSGGNIELSIFDILGRKVKILADNYIESGQYVITWDGANAEGSDAPSGTYILALRNGESVTTRRMTLLK